MQKAGWNLETQILSNASFHKNHLNKTYSPSFSSRYNVDKLVYYCLYDTIEVAIAEKKRIKGGNRAAKIRLIELINPNWKDLWVEDVSKW